MFITYFIKHPSTNCMISIFKKSSYEIDTESKFTK